jgi:hypothetical protein
MSRATPAGTRRRAAIAIVLSLVCGALVAISVHVSLLWTANADGARTSRVTATVLEPAAPDRSRPAIGHWTTTDGTRRTGVIPAPPKQGAGAGHPIWIDESGHVTTQPKSAVHRGVQTALAGISVAAAMILLIGRASRPDDPIDVEWQDVAPGWQRRHL